MENAEPGGRVASAKEERLEGWPSGEVRDLGKLIYSGIDLENKNRTKPQEELRCLRTLEGTVKGEK